MSDAIDYAALAVEAELIVQGGRNWLSRARAGEIKASPEAIERRADRLELQLQILDIMQRAQARRIEREKQNG